MIRRFDYMKDGDKLFVVDANPYEPMKLLINESGYYYTYDKKLYVKKQVPQPEYILDMPLSEIDNLLGTKFDSEKLWLTSSFNRIDLHELLADKVILDKESRAWYKVSRGQIVRQFLDNNSDLDTGCICCHNLCGQVLEWIGNKKFPLIDKKELYDWIIEEKHNYCVRQIFHYKQVLKKLKDNKYFNFFEPVEGESI